jgi:heparin binding hemagglutinin HbhA
MSPASRIRKPFTDPTPVFVAVGVTDLAVERIREAGSRASAIRGELTPDGLRQSYGTFASRGERLVRRVRTQKASRDLAAQVGTTLSLGRGAMTSVRRAATDIERSARATLSTSRHEAAETSGEVAGAAARQAQESAGAARQSAARTRTAARRTAATARTRSGTASAAAKRATTSAQKSAAAAVRATEQAADKVGD